MAKTTVASLEARLEAALGHINNLNMRMDKAAECIKRLREELQSRPQQSAAPSTREQRIAESMARRAALRAKMQQAQH